MTQRTHVNLDDISSLQLPINDNGSNSTTKINKDTSSTVTKITS